MNEMNFARPVINTQAVSTYIYVDCCRMFSIELWAQLFYGQQIYSKNSSVNHFLCGPSEGVSTLDVANFIDLIGDLDKCITTQGNS